MNSAIAAFLLTLAPSLTTTSVAFCGVQFAGPKEFVQVVSSMPDARVLEVNPRYVAFADEKRSLVRAVVRMNGGQASYVCRTPLRRGDVWRIGTQLLCNAPGAECDRLAALFGHTAEEPPWGPSNTDRR